MIEFQAIFKTKKSKHLDDFACEKIQNGSYTVQKGSEKLLVLSWQNDVCVSNFLSFNVVKFKRILDSYMKQKSPLMSKNECVEHINRYLRDKFIVYSTGLNILPFRIPNSFMKLLRYVLNISYQMYTNPILFAGETEHFSSQDKTDVCFGSCGIWKDMEAITEGAGGQFFVDSRTIVARFAELEKMFAEIRHIVEHLLLRYQTNLLWRI